MPALVRRFNYRNVELHPDTKGETVGVLLSSGDCRYYPWLGFIDREDALRLQQARPVKLDVCRYCDESTLAGAWIDVPEGKYVQGCLTAAGVYALTIAKVRLVPGNLHRSDSECR